MIGDYPKDMFLCGGMVKARMTNDMCNEFEMFIREKPEYRAMEDAKFELDMFKNIMIARCIHVVVSPDQIEVMRGHLRELRLAEIAAHKPLFTLVMQWVKDHPAPER